MDSDRANTELGHAREQIMDSYIHQILFFIQGTSDGATRGECC
jgi:hypothetical protein